MMEVFQDAEAGLGPGCSEGFPGAIILQKLLLPICSSFCPESSCTDNLGGGLMVSLIFDVSKGVSKGSGWEMGRKTTLQPRPLGLSMKLAVNIFVLGHDTCCRSGGFSALL